MQENTLPKRPKPILVLSIQTSQRQIAEARKEGYFVILTDNPDSVRVVIPEPVEAPCKIAQAALGALVAEGGSHTAMRFVKNLNSLLFPPESAPAKPEEAK